MKIYIARAPGYTNESDVSPFVRTLLTYLEKRGIEYSGRVEDGPFKVALGNQWVPPLDIVKRVRAEGAAFVHRLDGRAKAVVKIYEQDEENRKINAIADWTVFQSRYVEAHTARRVETIFGTEEPICRTPERGSIIYNGVDREVFTEQGPRESLDGEFRVLHVAFTAGVRKGVGDLVRMAELLKGNKKIRFYTIGRQTDDAVFGRQLEQLENVTHFGVIVDRARLAAIMRSCHVLFFPSRNDYCPNTVIESMSCGLPVLYHPSGGTPELVVADELVAGLEMSEQNPVYPLYAMREHQKELSQRAVEIVRRRFTAEHMGDAYLALFQRLVSERRKATAASA